MELNTTQLSALTRLFSSTVFGELAKKGRSPLLMRLLRQTQGVASRQSHRTIGDAFEAAFALLRTAGMRNEYIYRSALTQKILMGKHSLRTASMLNEFRAGTCKADLVILNGTATVYEIKSERDSLARLANQVHNYQKVFATVNVISSEDHVEGVRQVVPDHVGIMCLSRRYQVSVEREAIDRPDQICPVTVLESLRSAEAAAILEALGVVVPAVPNTQRHGVMRELFAKLEPAPLHSEMVRTLKRTRSLAPLSDLVDQLPASLHAAALSVPVRRSDHGRLVEAVATPLDAAMAWI
ncbi:sce7726 family protein [Mesorhizobium sp. M0320]|uniref:sce7726 family protein n=1 Tax=Mesorhizobium sp. M0320 TaxID=2956936 RepID=UPI00333D7EED